MQGLVAFVKTLGPARIAAMGAVTAALIGFFAFVILRVTAPAMTPLFTELTVEDSAAIIKDLDRQAIAYEIKNDGAIIMVPKDRVTRLRMKFAEGGLPKGGGIGYEIFDKSDALGATSFVQNINHLRALEGELVRTIKAIDRVQAARVHLVLPERPLFARDKAEPSASIVLKVRGALEMQQVRAIRHLVATAVNGLKPERVSVVDETGRLLADGSMPETGVLGASADERQIAFERRLREQIESIVTSIVGPGRARVQLTADFDFNRVTQTSDRFDPEGRVVRSTQTREEQSQSGDNAQGQVTAANELPGANAQQGANNRDQSKKSEEIVNYDISRTTRTEVIEGGRVNRISVAVLVDGAYTKNDKGESTYAERSKDELDRIAALVRTAIGFDQKRGDQVEVINLRFAEVPTQTISEPTGIWAMLQFTKEDIMRAIELGVMLLLSLIVLLMVVRPLVRRVITPEKAAAALAAVTGGSALPAPATANGADAGEAALTAAPNQTTKMIDMAQVQGQVHAQSIQKVGELADRNPNETVSIIRSWLHDTP
ncbi:flagellar basal-body MS-ring/collar protein FliF [Xanthobacteraceae bacterium Astr-EGSB]|uniref:flagellar basal-body MS-ring/collar protein FliF n=1 Tax=Astrobacterium formosum TaxID=3069710 RepID=UPI0027B75BE4|nr:flagellar basal-body MS-ring/collar protein FliF [Xanthobacteraceae bacterium Astr-EGSB]